MLDRISVSKIQLAFTDAGYRVWRTDDGWMMMAYPGDSWKYMALDISQGYVLWSDLELRAQEANIDRDRFN